MMSKIFAQSFAHWKVQIKVPEDNVFDDHSSGVLGGQKRGHWPEKALMLL